MPSNAGGVNTLTRTGGPPASLVNSTTPGDTAPQPPSTAGSAASGSASPVAADPLVDVDPSSGVDVVGAAEPSVAEAPAAGSASWASSDEQAPAMMANATIVVTSRGRAAASSVRLLRCIRPVWPGTAADGQRGHSSYLGPASPTTVGPWQPARPSTADR